LRRVLPSPPEAARIAALLDSLTEQARAVNLFSPRQRREIERELAELRRLFEQLGYRRTA